MNNDLRINPNYAAVLKQYGLDSLEQVMAASAGEVMRKVPGRVTVRLEFPQNQVFYLKRHLPPNSRAATDGLREWNHIQTLSALGILCPTPVAAGSGVFDGAPCSFLITAAIPDSIPLDDFLVNLYGAPNGPSAWPRKRRLIAQLADLAKKFHNRGFHHKDFYLCHVFVNQHSPLTAPLAMIDLQRLGSARFFRRRWIVKDLAALNYSASSKFATNTDRLRFLFAYLGIDHLNPKARRLIRAVLRKTERIRRHDLKLRSAPADR